MLVLKKHNFQLWLEENITKRRTNGKGDSVFLACNNDSETREPRKRLLPSELEKANGQIRTKSIANPV